MNHLGLHFGLSYAQSTQAQPFPTNPYPSLLSSSVTSTVNSKTSMYESFGLNQHVQPVR
jgi:hypothetical protein